MRKVLFVCIFIFMGQVAFADVVTFKDGHEATYKNVERQGDQYCVWLSSGQFCFPAADVASVKKEEASTESANVVYGNSNSNNNSNSNRSLRVGSVSAGRRIIDFDNLK